MTSPEQAPVPGITREITDQELAGQELEKKKIGQLQLLFDLATSIARAEESGEIYRAAVQGLVRVVGADRAAVLEYDSDTVMRFKASTGLSDRYRADMRGRSTWPRGARDAQPITVADVLQDPSRSAFRDIFEREGIRSLALIPILGSGGLIGKFVIYYNTPHEFQAEELQIAQTIAAHVALAAERRQAEMALRASEERFRVMFLQAAVGIAQAGLDGEWLLVNDRFCEILGYTQAELRGKTFLDVTHPDDRENSVAAGRQIVAGEISSWSTEKRYVRKDRATVWARLHLSLVRGPDGQPQYFIAVVQDITEKIQAENALRESERRLTLAQGAAHIGAWDADLDTNITRFSGDCASLYGLPNDHPPLMNEEWIALVHPADRHHVASQLRESIKQRRFLDTEFRVVWPDGTVHWLLGKGTVFLDNSGRPIRMAGVNLDITARKEAEAALLESEERFRSLFENATVGLYRTTPAGRIEMANPALVRMLGYESFAALAERNLEESGFEPEYSRSAFRKTLEQEGQIRGLEATWTRNDASVVFVRESARCVKDESGAVCFYEGIVEDVTERKRTEDALRRSEQKFAAAFHLGPAAMSIVDTEDGDCILDINEGFEQVSGYSRVELLGRRVPELGIWSEPEEYSQAQRRFRTDGRLSNFEFHFRRKSGEIRTGLVSAEPMEINNRRCAITCTTDLTERKRAEEILKASEEKYRALVETTDTGYLITDKEGKVIDANREYVRLTGHRELGEILGRSVIEWTAAHEKQKNAEALARCVKDGFIRDLVIDYVDGENRITPVEINAKVTRGGESLRIISLCRDISDRKRAEEMRLQLKLTQAQKMESIGRLAGGVAHDFNNLLTVINGYAAFLSEQLAVRDPLRRYALEIGEAGRRAASLTSQLLAFSRKQAIMPKAINLNAVLAEAERMLQRLIGEDIELVSSLAPRLGLVMADPDQIHQIIMNLAVNARDAMPKGGKFEITTAEVELDETAAAAHPDAASGRYVQLTVTDTGTGMTEEVRRKIFEPFFTTKEQGKGTGLGLSMVFGIVRQHDGWIDVKSEPGRGSTFRIHLPRIDGASQTDEAKPAAANVSYGDETVLVVEDQEAVRGLARRILEAHGYHVLEAASGAEAHAVASRHTGEIDLLLTDVVMPGMDGFLLSEKLRDLRPKLRTILMSGYTADLVAHRDALASGLAYIQKPFGPEELATKVRGILDAPV